MSVIYLLLLRWSRGGAPRREPFCDIIMSALLWMSSTACFIPPRTAIARGAGPMC